MGRYFDYRDWEIEEICDSIRQRIKESKQPIPNKVIKHSISIIYRLSESSYCYKDDICRPFSYIDNTYRDFKSREEAEIYLNSCGWLEKIKDNFWIETGRKKPDTYTTKDGEVIPCHYEIYEYDYEQYEDGNYYTLYTAREKELLSETLYQIEKARAYIRAYDYCCDNGCFGEDDYTKHLEEELNDFKENYSEELSEDDNDY